MKHSTLLLLLTSISFLLPSLSEAYQDETDLTGNSPLIERSSEGLVLYPNEVLTDGPGDTVEVYRTDHGQDVYVSGLEFVKKPKGGECTYSADLRHNEDAFAVYEKNNALYSIAFTAPCDESVRIFFNEESDGAHALGIWSIGEWAYALMTASVGNEFWKKSVSFHWPADGDYFSYGNVYITDGRKWDVVAHELGHAIDFMGYIAAGGGGSHKIDQCYNEGLAFTEGFASFFAAWLMIELTDPDAQFEYMVPRRAPITVENIPDDVCDGETNEWRVFGFLWDLIDLNNDGEAVEGTFDFVFTSLMNRDSRSLSEAVGYLIRDGYSKEVIELLWEMDIREPAVSTKRPAFLN